MDWTSLLIALIGGVFAGGGVAGIILAVSKSHTENRSSAVDAADRLNDIAADTVERLNRPLHIRLDELEEERNRYKAGFELASAELGLVRRTIDDYEVRWANAERDNIQTGRDKAELRIEVQQLKDRLAGIGARQENESQAREALEQEIIVLKTTIVRHSRHIVDLQDERVELKRQIADLTHERNEFVRQISELYQRVEDFKSALEQRDETIQELRAEFERRLSEKDDEIADLKRQLVHKDEEIADLNRQLSEFKKQLNGGISGGGGGA